MNMKNCVCLRLVDDLTPNGDPLGDPLGYRIGVDFWTFFRDPIFSRFEENGSPKWYRIGSLLVSSDRAKV